MIEPNNGFSNWEIRTLQDSILFSKNNSISYKLLDLNYEFFTFVTHRSKTINKGVSSNKLKTSSGYLIASNGVELKEIWTNDDLIWLIGEIDNIYEAVLIARLNGYSTLPFKNHEINRYKFRKGHYLLKMTKMEKCPEFGNLIEPKFIYKTVQLKLDISGITVIKFGDIYKNDCLHHK